MLLMFVMASVEIILRLFMRLVMIQTHRLMMDVHLYVESKQAIIVSTLLCLQDATLSVEMEE